MKRQGGIASKFGAQWPSPDSAGPRQRFELVVALMTLRVEHTLAAALCRRAPGARFYGLCSTSELKSAANGAYIKEQPGEIRVTMGSSKRPGTRVLRIGVLLSSLALLSVTVLAQALGDPPDISQDFQKFENVYFIGSRLASFDPASGQGTLQWDRYQRNTTLSL